MKKLLYLCEDNALYRQIVVPSLYIFLVICGAILLAVAYHIDGMISIAGAGLIVVSCILIPLVYRNSIRIHGGQGNASRMIVMVTAGVGAAALICHSIHNTTAIKVLPGGKNRWMARVEGVVDKRYYQEADISFSRDDAEFVPGSAGHGENYRGLARISGGTVVPGDTIIFSACPVVTGERGGTDVSSRRSLMMKGVCSVFYLDNTAVATAAGGGSWRHQARAALAGNCDRMFNRKTSAIIKALYFGNQDYIDKITMNDFKRAGVFHILSAGGLHVGVVAAIPFFLMGRLRINRRIIAAVAVIVVAAYLYMTDVPVSLLRSCIMFFMYAAQSWTGRKSNIINTFFLSGSAIMLMFPHELLGLGFQLSYGATLGILLFHGHYRKSLAWLPGPVAGSLALTVSAQLLVMPILFVRLNEINLMGFISNIIVVPLMSLLLIASLAAQILSIVPGIAGWAGSAVNTVYALCGFIVRFLSGFEGHFYVPSAGPVLIASYCLLPLPLVSSAKGGRVVSFSIVAAVAAAWVSLYPPGTPGETIAVVRHCAGTLVMTKQGTLLSIAGQVPEKSSADAFMSHIKALSHREVELYITDPDFRNMAGYLHLLKRLPVRRCHLSGSFSLRKYTRRLCEILERDGAELVIHDDGTVFRNPPVSSVSSHDRIYDLYRQARVRHDLLAGDLQSKNCRVEYLTLH